MDAILLLIRIFLAMVFTVAAVGKLKDPKGSADAAANFGVPEDFRRAFVVGLPIAELLVAVLLLPVTTAWFGALGATALLGAFIAAMVVKLLRGETPDCHCFGAIHSAPVSASSIARNAALVALALWLVVSGPSSQGLQITRLNNDHALVIVFGTVISALLVAALYFLREIAVQQKELTKRIEVLEYLSADGANGREVTREEAGSIQDSLPIGAFAPDFGLAELSGREVRLDHLLGEGKALVLFFVSPNCSPCRALLPEISGWAERLADKASVILVSSGTLAENQTKFGGAGVRALLVDENRTVAGQYFAKWTPSAVIINTDGLIACRLAVGDKAIREVVGKFITDGAPRFVTTTDDSLLGKTVPEFESEDISGRKLSSAELGVRRTLILFWSLTCPHCQKMLPDLVAWEANRTASDPQLIVFSNGTPDENAALGLSSSIVVDDGYKISATIGMLGTPSAVLVDEDGVVISETATGAGNIWALLGRNQD